MVPFVISPGMQESEFVLAISLRTCLCSSIDSISEGMILLWWITSIVSDKYSRKKYLVELREMVR